MDLAKLAADLSAPGILALVVLFVLLGRIVPRSTLTDLRSDKDHQIDTWKTAYERSEEAREIMRGQITELLELARTTTHVIEALPEATANTGRRPARVVPSEED